MGKRSVRVVVVRRWVTVLLLLATTAAIVGITISISGKAYSKVDAEPFRELRVLQRRMAEGPVPMPTVVALVMPMILNIILFLPWGFFMFLVLDVPSRPTALSYLMTVLLAFLFSAGVEASQYFLPTRVMDVNDVIWNASGAFFGAFAGHMRKRVRVAFE